MMHSLIRMLKRHFFVECMLLGCFFILCGFKSNPNFGQIGFQTALHFSAQNDAGAVDSLLSNKKSKTKDEKSKKKKKKDSSAEREEDQADDAVLSPATDTQNNTSQESSQSKWLKFIGIGVGVIIVVVVGGGALLFILGLIDDRFNEKVKKVVHESKETYEYLIGTYNQVIKITDYDQRANAELNAKYPIDSEKRFMVAISTDYSIVDEVEIAVNDSSASKEQYEFIQIYRDALKIKLNYWQSAQEYLNQIRKQPAKTGVQDEFVGATQERSQVKPKTEHSEASSKNRMIVRGFFDKCGSIEELEQKYSIMIERSEGKGEKIRQIINEEYEMKKLFF